VGTGIGMGMGDDIPPPPPPPPRRLYGPCWDCGTAERPKEARSGSSRDFFLVRRDLCGTGGVVLSVGDWGLGGDERKGDSTRLSLRRGLEED
jgi:hypothetical protein